jgi:hypothetical protein
MLENILPGGVTIDSGFIGIVILFVAMIGGGFAIWMTLDSRFPKKKFDVRDRGMRRLSNYRILYTAIFKDDLLGMLFGRFEYMGDLSQMTYYTQPNGTRIYDSYMRHDYLFGYNDVSKDDLEKKPVLVVDSHTMKRPVGQLEGDNGVFHFKGTLYISEGLLFPLQIQTVNHLLTEKEVINGKEIGTGFIQVMRKTQEVIEKNNPVMGVLISAIPLFIMGGLFCLMLYVSYLALGSSAEKVAGYGPQVIEAARQIANSTCR